MSTASTSTGSAGATQRRNPGIALLVIVLCQFMVGLDATVVNIALPEIRADLDFSRAGLAWVSSSYTLAFGGLLLLGGRVGDILGRRRVFIAGLVLFAAASLLGGFADSQSTLILWRVIQGVGAAMAAPNSLALIGNNFEPGPEMNKAYGAVAGSYAASLAVGLLLGGVLTGQISWRWVMFINVPFALLVLVLAPMFVKEADKHPGKFDIGGTILSAAFMIALVYGLLHAAEHGWSNAETVVPIGASVVFLITFLFVEGKAEQPVMPLQLFTSRNRSGGYFALVGLVATMAAMNFFVSQFLQDGLDMSPLVAGLAFLPMAACILLAGAQAAKLLGKVGAKPVILGGSALICAGMLWLSQLSQDTTYLSGVLGPVLLFGSGAGLAMTAVSATVLSDVSGKHAGSAASVLEVMQWIGFTLGISILTTVFSTFSRDAAAERPGDAKHALIEGLSGAFTASLAFVVISVVIAVTVIKKAPPAPAAEEPSKETEATV